MKIYEPNFNDPRIRARALKCLNYVELYLARDTRTIWIARNEMYRHFSDTSKPLGRWLKNLVLITQDDYFNLETGVCKRYRRNSKGIAELKHLLGIDNFEPQLSAELAQQVESGEFEYESKSDRLFNPIQYIARERRESILANHGYRHNYDIKGAAPRLLLQHAQKHQPDFDAPALTYYIGNTTQARQQIAQRCGISISDVKAIVNAMLHGAYISRNSHSQILQQLNYDYQAIDQLKACELVQNLRDDIRGLWSILRSTLPVRYATNCRGRDYRVRLTGRDKSGLYRQLESVVAGSIRRYLKRDQVRHLWIHDGWCSDKAVDTRELCAQVRRQTGFVIELDWTVYE